MIMAQCYQASICVLCIMHQIYRSILCTPWLSAVHPRLINVHQVSTAQCCVSGISVAVHHASIWFDVVHPRLNDVHQASAWFNAVYQAYMSLYVSMLCIRHHYGRIYYGSLLCTPQFMARSCASGITINMAQTCASGTVLLDSVHPWLKPCNMNQYSLIQHNITQYTYHIILCPLPFLLLCLQLTLERKKDNRTKSRFGWLLLCYLSIDDGQFWWPC